MTVMSGYSIDENLTLFYCQQCVLVLCFICWSWYWSGSRESCSMHGLSLVTAGLDYNTA